LKKARISYIGIWATKYLFLGWALKNRTPENQKVETVIKANVLNVFAALGTMCFC
jgi:hypothetical protein